MGQVLEQNQYMETSNFDNFMNQDALKEFKEFNNALKLYCDHKCLISNFIKVSTQLPFLPRNRRAVCR